MSRRPNRSAQNRRDRCRHRYPAATPQSGSPGLFALLVAGIVGGLVALAMAVALFASGLLSGPERDLAEKAVAGASEATTAVQTHEARIGALEGEASGLSGDLKSLAARVDSLQSTVEADQKRLADVATGPGAGAGPGPAVEAGDCPARRRSECARPAPRGCNARRR